MSRRIEQFSFVVVSLLAAALTGGAQIIAPGFNGGQLTPPPSKVAPEQRCTVSGQVANAVSGEPIKKANLRLTAANSPSGSGIAGALSQQGYAVTSDAGGTFRIEGVEPGTYNLSGQRTGFLNSNYGAKGPRQLGTSITLSPSQNLTGITVALTPQAVISGKVLEEDGEPSASTMVQVMGPIWQRGKKRYFPMQSGNTNDLGEFRIANLSPGKYLLSAQPRGVFSGQAEVAAPANGKPDIRPVLTYYPGSPTLESATALEIKAGQDLPGLEIRLRNAATFHVRGHVIGAALEDGKQHGVISLRPKSSAGLFFFGGQSPVKPDGSFDISGVSPGSYYLTLMLMSGNIRSGGQQSVEVASGDLNDVNLATAPPFAVRGSIKIEGSPQAGAVTASAGSAQVHLSPAEFGVFLPPGQTKVEQDGSFLIENVTAGLYALNVGAPSGTYLKSVLNGQTEIKGSDLDLTGGSPPELQIIFRYGVAEVAGSVQTSQGANNPVAAQILVIPEPLNADNSGTRLSNTDTNGSFSLKQLAPGRYRAFAFAQLDPLQTQNPEILKELASKGTEFEVKENDRKQVTLLLISAEDLNHVLAQADLDAQ